MSNTVRAAAENNFIYQVSSLVQEIDRLVAVEGPYFLVSGRFNNDVGWQAIERFARASRA